MPAEVNVGPPVLTINEGTTVMVTDTRGEIDTLSEQGVFSADTRFVSHYAIYINGAPWTLVSSAQVHYYAAELHMVNPRIPSEDGEVPESSQGLRIARRASDGIHEDIDIINHAEHPVRFELEIALRSDFADIFEVRKHELVRRGRILSDWDASSCELTTSYSNKAFERTFIYGLANSTTPPTFANGRVVFDISLRPGERWHTCARYVLVADGLRHEPVKDCRGLDEDRGPLARVQAEWLMATTTLRTGNQDLNRTFERSVKDLGSLRMYDAELGPDVWIPAAGVPWYVALFGRDSLIVSMQSMLMFPAFAVGTLKRLAEHQATAIDDWRDAEPGKILHELRTGELAQLGLSPHSPYYGSADSTPLYLILLHEAWLWLGDDNLLREYRDVAIRCLEWIDRYGDLDGDGFQEHQARTPGGYENMGWKDSEDAIVYPDGSQVRQPKALCELQGYAFDAKMRCAEIFDALGEPDRALKLRAEAAELRRRFDEAFWCEEEGFYAISLDPKKRAAGSISTNPGHCLWSGIIPPDRAARMVKRFFQNDMWNGWGLRTLASSHPAYNPYSYHRGSVWPHDNAIIALGLKRYGYSHEVSRVARGIFEAAAYFSRNRLPELYAGLSVGESSFPVQYLGANIPQAWAAGSVFQLLQAILGLRADAPHGKLYVDPSLPSWLPDIELHGLRVGRARLSLRFWRDGHVSRWEVLDQTPGTNIAVIQAAWAPWELSQMPKSDETPVSIG